ncbi:Fanconi anemia group J protein [Nowakowskiella sp. JEL0407]|nr:Fanconi anemia group J protein [Nowakowskiella sp. JEL0407]
MEKLISALNSKKNALLESPTGTGKTLALLISSLSWRDSKNRAYHDALSRKKAHDREKEKLALSEAQNSRKVVDKSHSVDLSEFLLDDYEEFHWQTSVQIHPRQKPITKSQLDSETELQLSPKPPKIYFASRTQKQLQQAVKQLRMTKYKPKMSILASREHYCINPAVKKSSNVNDECSKLLNEDMCLFVHGTHDVKHSSLGNAVWDIEDLVNYGKKKKLCPYFTARTLASKSDIVLAPYNYIIDPQIREASDIDTKDAVIIIDEAHNIEDACISAGSFQVSEKSLTTIKEEILAILEQLAISTKLKTKYPTLENSYRMLHSLALSALGIIANPKGKRQNCDSSTYLHLMSGPVGVDLLHLNDTDMGYIQKSLEEVSKIASFDKENRKGKYASDTATVVLSDFSLRIIKGPRPSLVMVLNYLLKSKNDYRVALVGHLNEGTKNLEFWSMNPSLVFKEIADPALSVILSSGTLSPIRSMLCELGTEFPITLEADHVVDDSQVWCGTISTMNKVTLENNYANMQSYQYRDTIGHCILNIIRTASDGVLVFVSSYSVLNNLVERWKSTGLFGEMGKFKQVFIEPRNNNGGVFDKMVKKYETVVDGGRGAIFFCIFRGKMSEGINFADKKARVVLAIGIPFPNIKDTQVQEKKNHNNLNYSQKKGTLSGTDWLIVRSSLPPPPTTLLPQSQHNSISMKVEKSPKKTPPKNYLFVAKRSPNSTLVNDATNIRNPEVVDHVPEVWEQQVPAEPLNDDDNELQLPTVQTMSKGSLFDPLFGVGINKWTKPVKSPRVDVSNKRMFVSPAVVDDTRSTHFPLVNSTDFNVS